MSSTGIPAYLKQNSNLEDGFVHVVVETWRGLVVRTRCYRDATKAKAYANRRRKQVDQQSDDLYVITVPVM